MKFLRTATVIVSLSLVASSAMAWSRSYIKDNGYEDLKFKQPTTEIGEPYGAPIYLPEKQNGAGVVFLPSCAGIHQRNDTDVMRLVKAMLKEGYTVAISDFSGQGRPRKNCGKDKPLGEERLIKDMYVAATELAKVPGVNPNMIFTSGTSLGAMVSAMGLQDFIIEEAKEKGYVIPVAAVAFYGGCKYPDNTWLSSDIARPIIWMSGTKDVERGTGCGSWLYNKIKSKQPLSEFIDYEGASHCWDCHGLNGFSKSTYYGRETYIYDEEITATSYNDALKFMRKIIEQGVTK